MVKHIVLFQLKKDLTEEVRQEVMNNFKTAIEALPKEIKFIRQIHVGLNMNPAETWDICLESAFDSLEDVKAYSAHPAHIAAAGTIKDYKADRSCVDFEI